jgi:hypothetical protein
MPVHRQQKCTTTNASDSPLVPPAPSMPDQQEFRLHLRSLARGAVRIVLEDVMREELDALIGVGWGESSRQQQRLSQWLLQPRVSARRQAVVRRCRCPEIARVVSIRRSLSATAALNPKSPMGSPRCS